MKWVTHQAGALALGVWFRADPVLLGGMVAGAVLPDMLEQMIARRDRAIFARIHRGFLHWYGLYVVLFVVALCLPIKPVEQSALVGLAFGALSHLVMDGLNPSGVPVWPFARNPRWRMPLVATGSPGEWCVLAVLLAVSALGGYRLETSWWRRAGYFLQDLL